MQVSNGVFSVAYKALIDTGSPRNVFPRGCGDMLQVEFPRFSSDCNKKITLMGRDWPAVTATVHLVLRPFDDLGWDAEVDFVYDEGLPFGLLGYEGFFTRWAVSFNGVDGYFIVELADEFHDRQPDDVMEGLARSWPDLFP